MGTDHPHLEAVLDLIRDSEELWSSHVICSLSHKDKYYSTGEKYWRSPVWININNLAMKRLLVSTPCLCSSFFRANDIMTHSRFRSLLNSPAHISKKRVEYTRSFG